MTVDSRISHLLLHQQRLKGSLLTLTKGAVLLRSFRHVNGAVFSHCAWMPDNRSFLASCLDLHYGFMKGAIDVEAPTFWETKHRV